MFDGVTPGARLLTVFAVLAGVFLMHGLPAQDCSAAMPAMGAVAHTGMDMGSGHGGVCVFTTPSRDHLPILALVLLFVAVLLTVLWRPLLVAGPSRRGPPLFGARLLTVVCVSRT
ncbi:hypothetical protein KUTG_02847 [Kutzneria sp. 744]|nr:hypothetical protein KUTG_02847 [Kutzneria sp. 744]